MKNLLIFVLCFLFTCTLSANIKSSQLELLTQKMINNADACELVKKTFKRIVVQSLINETKVVPTDPRISIESLNADIILLREKVNNSFPEFNILNVEEKEYVIKEIFMAKTWKQASRCMLGQLAAFSACAALDLGVVRALEFAGCMAFGVGAVAAVEVATVGVQTPAVAAEVAGSITLCTKLVYGLALVGITDCAYKSTTAIFDCFADF